MATYSTDPGQRLTLLSGLVIVAFMAFGLAISVYRIAVFDNSVAHIKDQNEEIKQRISVKRNEVEYYRSAQFKNKFAKEKLQLVSPGERVLVLLPQEVVLDTFSSTTTDEQRISPKAEESLRLIPIFRHWQMYLFHPEDVEKLFE